MKPTTCVLLLCVFGHATSRSQENTALGVEAGSGITMLRSDFYRDHGRATAGFSAGFTAQRFFNRWWSFKSGFNYERKGVYFEREPAFPYVLPYPIPPGEKIRYKEMADYITVPVMARFHAGKKTQFLAEAGAFAGLLVRHRERRWLLDNERTYSRMGGGLSFDAGIIAGAGVAVPLGQRCALSFLVRNTIGLLKMEGSYAYSEPKTFSSTVLTGFSYRLTGKRDGYIRRA